MRRFTNNPIETIMMNNGKADKPRFAVQIFIGDRRFNKGCSNNSETLIAEFEFYAAQGLRVHVWDYELKIAVVSSNKDYIAY